MKPFLAPFSAWIAALFLLVSGASGSLIRIDSYPGLTADVFGPTVAITPHPLWQPGHPANPGDPADTAAVWISNRPTGYGDAAFQPYMGTLPVVTVSHEFASNEGLLNLKVWADDTADVLLDGAYLQHAVFTQSTCSGQPVGCRPEDFALLSAPLSGGTHTLDFVLYQVGTGLDNMSNPFGLLYTGTAPAQTPEPLTFLLIGSGLVGLGLVRRRR